MSEFPSSYLLLRSFLEVRTRKATMTQTNPLGVFRRSAACSVFPWYQAKGEWHERNVALVDARTPIGLKNNTTAG